MSAINAMDVQRRVWVWAEQDWKECKFTDLRENDLFMLDDPVVGEDGETAWKPVLFKGERVMVALGDPYEEWYSADEHNPEGMRWTIHSINESAYDEWNRNEHDLQYHGLAQHILDNGVLKTDRTGTGTLSVFGYQMRFNLQDGFPLLTTKKLPTRIIAEELLWFLEGNTDAGALAKKNVNIWTPDAYRWHIEQGGMMTEEEFKEWLKNNPFDLGPIYGKQWRSWETGEMGYKEGDDYPSRVTIDQITQVIQQIKENPDSRRLIVSAWNPGELHKMALPPCHILFQFYVADGKLSCQLYQRSGDVFLGIPFNIASYALLTHMVAQQCDLEVGEFVHTIGDAHIYLNHVDQIKEQLSREPKDAPKLVLNKQESIFDYTVDDITIEGYDPHPAIKGKVSVG